MTDTVTVFVKLTEITDGGVVTAGDIRVFDGNAPGGMNISLPGWVRFNDVPVQQTPTLRTTTTADEHERWELERMNRFADRGEKYSDDHMGDTT